MRLGRKRADRAAPLVRDDKRARASGVTANTWILIRETGLAREKRSHLVRRHCDSRINNRTHAARTNALIRRFVARIVRVKYSLAELSHARDMIDEFNSRFNPRRSFSPPSLVPSRLFVVHTSNNVERARSKRFNRVRIRRKRDRSLFHSLSRPVRDRAVK